MTYCSAARLLAGLWDRRSEGRSAEAPLQQVALPLLGKPSRSFDEVDRVHAIASAALGVIHDVVKYCQAAKIIVFTDLVRAAAQFSDRKACQRSGRSWRLHILRRVERRDPLCSGAKYHAFWLRVGSIAGVTGGEENVVAIAVVQKCCTAVVAAIRVGLGESEFAMLVSPSLLHVL